MHSETTSKIEALLFAAGEPVTIEKLSKQLKFSKDKCSEEIEKLQQIYEKSGSGLQVIRKTSRVQLVSNAKYGETVAKFLSRSLNEPLSRAAVEVLSVIAYRGPLTRSQIEHIRGVNCSFTLRNLAIRGLVERKENPLDSRAYLYEASMEFIKSMGIGKIEELPDYEQLHSADIATEQDRSNNQTETGEDSN